MAATALPIIIQNERVHLAVLTNSAMTCARRCLREYKFRYLMRRRPKKNSEALRFGTFFHVGLEAWWGCPSTDPVDRLASALTVMQSRAATREEDSDPFDLVKAEELMLGYTARWASEQYETIAVEKKFEAPLINPDTGAASRTYRVAGKLDVVAKRLTDGRIIQVEHKTTSSDIGLGSDYWRKVSALDTQVSTYLAAAKAAGVEIEECLYDVIRKVGLRPGKATPPEQRKYTQAGFLYKGQRDKDETPEEFRARVNAEIAESPAKYFARGPVVRLERDEAEHAADTWQTAHILRECETAKRFPRNPSSCERFGGRVWCDYFAVCSGAASIDDDELFRTAEHDHEELAEV